MNKFEYHPAANIFDMMSAEEFNGLKEDILENGQLQPILIDAKTGTIIDGRNRYEACLELDIIPLCEPWEGDDPVAFVLSMNLHRRHLNESQRGMVAARIANLTEGRPDKTASIDAVSQTQAAQILNVSRPSVQRAKEVLDKGAPSLVQAVDSGEVAVSTAAVLTNLPKTEQVEVVAKGKDEILAMAKKIRAEQHAERKQERIARITEVAPIEGKYRIIYADPPWSYRDSCEAGAIQSSGALDKYPCMSIEELCQMPIKDIALDDAVLFMWVTSPLLEEAFPVINAWGFNYKTSFVWDKVKHNMGHYNSVRHEFLLICGRGRAVPDVGVLKDSVVVIERTDKHSEKPEYFRQMIDELYPYGSRIELFARVKVDGWAAYGNEI